VSEIILETQALSRSFASGEDSIEVLQEIDFFIGSGRSASIQGESGSGKSTFLHLLAGLDSPTSGAVFWEGTDLKALDNAILAKKRGSLVGMVFQSYYLVPELRALENVLLAARITGILNEKTEERALALLERVGLSDRMTSLPSTLSGGEKQRVAIARALITQPKALLADEPTGNLDEETGDSIMDLLLELCAEKEVALVLVTHNPAYARRLDQSWRLKQGRLEEQS
jgi:lipoprotein-releasing system ATP-binding protein